MFSGESGQIRARAGARAYDGVLPVRHDLRSACRLLALATLCATAALQAAPAARLSDLDGRAVDPFQASAGAKAIVFLFTGVECPISNRYAPVAAALHERFASKGVRFWLIYPSRFDEAAAIRTHLKAFSYPFGALRDPDHVLARLTGASVTPEAALFDSGGHQVYRGRIDDRYVGLSVERPAPTTRDLDEAISAVLAGKRAARATTQVVGCFIE